MRNYFLLVYGTTKTLGSQVKFRANSLLAKFLVLRSGGFSDLSVHFNYLHGLMACFLVNCLSRSSAHSSIVLPVLGETPFFPSCPSFSSLLEPDFFGITGCGGWHTTIDLCVRSWALGTIKHCCRCGPCKLFQLISSFLVFFPWMFTGLLLDEGCIFSICRTPWPVGDGNFNSDTILSCWLSSLLSAPTTNFICNCSDSSRTTEFLWVISVKNCCDVKARQSLSQNTHHLRL